MIAALNSRTCAKRVRRENALRDRLNWAKYEAPRGGEKRGPDLFYQRKVFTTESTENHGECTEKQNKHLLLASCKPGGVGTAHHHDELRAFFVVLGVLRGKILLWPTRMSAEPVCCPGSRGAGDFRRVTLVGPGSGINR